MKCPDCGAEMSIGYYKLNSTWLGLLIHGASGDDLYFTTKDGHKQAVLRRYDEHEGYYCKVCGAKVILDRPPSQLSHSKIAL